MVQIPPSKIWVPEDCPYDSDAEPLPMDSDRVMKEIQRLYRTKDVGLKDAAKSISERSFRITMPRQKITVLIVGSHNAAKQKFLDLYFSDSRQTAGGGFISKVNYDNLDKIYITHGNQRKMLIGETVLDYCPHLAQLKNVPGIKEYLTTEIASRNTKSLVSFILAPENVPSVSVMPINDMVELNDENNNTKATASTTRKRSFDMRQAIGKLTEASDLIFIFFDPTGTTSPHETLQPFEHLWETHHEKMLLLLAKADENECSEETREDVLTRIVREVWKNPTIRRIGYLPEFYCPDLTSGIRDDERLWNVIQNSADQSVDKALLQLEQDAINIRDKLEGIRQRNEKAKVQNVSSPYAMSFGIFVLILLFLALWTSHFDEQTCRTGDLDMAGICKKLFINKGFITCLGLLVSLYMVYNFLSETQPSILTDDDEKILFRRIQFANHALYRKEAMEKSYIGMNLI